MAMLGVLGIFLPVVCYVLLRHLGNTSGLPINWPVVGMLPYLLLNVHRIHDAITDILLRTQNNFLFKGPWFSNMNIMVTVEPANIHHIMNSHFADFVKGPEFKAIFDILGDGIFNSDTDQWRNQRKLAMALIAHPKFHKFLVQTSTDKIMNGLLPILEHASDNAVVLDLQDIFQRFTFDAIVKMVTGFDPGCLSIEFPEIPFAKAADDAEEAVFYRHVIPESIWKLQKWLGVGQEKKMSRAWETFDLVIEKYLETKKEEMRKGADLQPDRGNEGTDLLTSYISLGYTDGRFLRDTILNLLLAGRDTTGSALTWFFWNLSRYPAVEKKIKEEINSVLATGEAGSDSINKLPYLHGAICESLRLYPPLPWQHKRAVKPDILPSGHRVDPKMWILFSLYSMGRMPSIWGNDCLEFRPERWITDKGEIKHEPSYKFLAFSTGPRTCLGKEVVFTQMKIVAARIIMKFHVKVVEGQNVSPCASVVLPVKNGLKVKITKRSD